MHIFRSLTTVMILGCLLLVGSIISIAKQRAATGTADTDDDVLGQVTAINTATKQFTLRICGGSGQSLTITTDARTEFDDFEEGGLANRFSSVAIGQLLEVELAIPNGGTPVAKGTHVAKEVELKGRRTDKYR